MHEKICDYSTQLMLHAPKSDLARLLGDKWFLSLERLAEMAGVPLKSAIRAAQGKHLHSYNERKIRKVLDKL